MEWKEEFSTGIEFIDEDHKFIVDLITRLQDSLVDGPVTKETGLVIKDLVEYIKSKIANEEQEMKKYNFPDFEQHKSMHSQLTEKVKDILIEMKYGKTITSFELINLLKNWFSNHMLDEDKKVVEFMKSSVRNKQNLIDQNC